MIFSSDEWLRYTRHIQLKNVGAQGQERLKNANVLIIGIGGLGSPVSLYLAAAGVGRLTLVDGDYVEITNLQRQVLFNEDDVGEVKSTVAKRKLQKLNSKISIHAVQNHFTKENFDQFDEYYDLVIDCTDNFSSRYLINDFCLSLKTPWVYAGVNQFFGQCGLFTRGKACFRCLFPESPKNAPDCNSAGILGVLPGFLGLFQASEAIKFLVGLETPLANHLLLFDALTYEMRKIQLTVNEQCQCQHSESFIGSSDSYQLNCGKYENPFAVSAKEFNHLRNMLNTTVLDVRDHSERRGFHVGGIHTPLGELEQKIKKLPATHTYLCYCQSGIRGQKAVQILRSHGIKGRNLEGGLANLLKVADVAPAQ